MSEKENNPHIKINPAGVISLFILYLLNGEKTFVCVMLSALAHEMGHLFAMKISGSKVSNFTFGFFNFNIKYNKYKTSYKTDIFISFSGPFFNIAFGVLSLLLGYTELFYANMSLAFLNLLPIDSLDGGNILRSFRQMKKEERDNSFDAKIKLYGRIFATSFVLLISFISDFNLSVVFMGVSSLICKNINTP